MSVTHLDTLDASREFMAGTARVLVWETLDEMTSAAAREAAGILKHAIEANGEARLIAATGNSQLAFIDKLVQEPGVDWKQVVLFHMDEYAGLSMKHPASFRNWIQNRIAAKVPVKEAYYLDGEAADLEAEMERYSKLLQQGPIDLAFVGIGENGHIAFNDPPVADFNDPFTVKLVKLDEACRRQQAGEGHFPSPDAVPAQAMTITCPGLFRTKAWVSVVPDRRKAAAVRCAIEGPLTTDCPASLLRTHPNTTLYLDRESASLLQAE